MIQEKKNLCSEDNIDIRRDVYAKRKRGELIDK